MPRTPKICGYSGSPKCLKTATYRGRCDDHKIAPFEGARDRWKSHRPKNWEALRRACKRRAGGRCEDCGAPGVEVDKIIPDFEDGRWTLDNAQLLCKPCHDVKTSQEAQRARLRRK